MRTVYFVQPVRDAPRVDFAKSVLLAEIKALCGSGANIGCWLIDARTDLAQAKQLLQQIRRQLVPGIYLRPILFLVNKSLNTEDLDSQGCDGIVEEHRSNAKISTLVNGFEPLNQWIEHLPDWHTAADTDLAFRILRFVASRKAEIKPVITAQNIAGYIYPQLSPLVDQADGNLLHIFEFLESQHLLSSRFITKAYLCSHCYSAFLSFKEVCPQCQTEDLTIDDMIHHFKCAYIGERAKYLQGDRLICPKCDRELKHIGVDYDKPAVIYRCNRCSHHFQDPDVITQCYNCGRLNAPEDQGYVDIKSFQATFVGRNAAVYGLDSLFDKIIASKVTFLPEAAFRQFLGVEIERIRRYQISKSSLAFIHIDIEQIYQQLGDRAQQLFEEIGSFFKSTLRKSDVITTHSQSIFMILMVETSKVNAETAIVRLTEAIAKLLANNLHYSPRIPYQLKTITVSTDIIHSLERFVKDHVH